MNREEAEAFAGVVTNHLAPICGSVAGALVEASRTAGIDAAELAAILRRAPVIDDRPHVQALARVFLDTLAQAIENPPPHMH